MKVSLQSALLLTGLAGVAAGPPQSGANCNISAQVDCRLTDGTNRVCKALEDTPYTQCGPVKVNWTYTYCNLNPQKMYFHQNLFEPLLHNIDVTSAGNFKKGEMAVGECREVTLPKVINTCQKRNTVASLKLEGNLSNKPNGGGNYCYAFAFSKQKVGRPPVPGPPPTPAPTFKQNPVVNDPADISMTLTCKYESQRGSGIFDRDCSGIESMNIGAASNCKIPVKYSYIVVNNSNSVEAKVQAIIDEETNSIKQGFEVLKPFGRSVTTVKSTIDVCKQKGAPVEKKAVALAAGLPSGIPGSASASLTIRMP